MVTDFPNPCAVSTKPLLGAVLRRHQYKAEYFSTLELVGQ